MAYVDAMVAAAPAVNKARYLELCKTMAAVFKEHGALKVIDCWEDDVPDGVLTSFPMAVKREKGESVILSWILWPSKAIRDDGWKKVMADPRMGENAHSQLFDGKRMIFGGFEQVAAA